MFRRITIKPRRKSPLVPGASPGTLQVSEGALPPKITLYVYNKSSYQVFEPTSYTASRQIMDDHPEHFFWFDIRGLGDVELLREIQDDFNISSLVLEDILHTFQRPKLEEFEDYCFVISRALCINENQMENEQLSFILCRNILFTFQENYTDCLDPVRNRLKDGKGVIRTEGPSYLMYALMDVTLDNYFLLISKFGDELDSLEDRLYRRPDKSITYQTQQVRRGFLMLRRAVWPERDKLNDLLRSNSELITETTKFYLRDAYDHSIQIIDLVENYKEVSSSLIDLYLSFTSNRMNEIMKVLTVISVIFIPLTFVAGVYGMNFAHRDPESGRLLQGNMPELYSEHGYEYTLLGMLVLGLLQLLWFWRKGWLK